MPPPDFKGNGNVAVVVLGHGSRAPGALELLEQVSARLAGQLGLTARAASLQFNRPTLAECCRELAAGGAGRIVVAPYFLFAGNHMREDIPAEIERIRMALPGVEFLLAEPLGDDRRLVDILAKRAGEMLTVGAAPTNDEAFSPNVLQDLQFPPEGNREALSQHPIEKQSFDIIDGLLAPEDPEDPQYQVVRRVVHTTGDVAIAPLIVASPGAIEAAVAALAAGAAIVCDVNMVATGIAPTAAQFGVPVACGVADERVAALARRDGLTRGATAMRLEAAAGGLDGAVVAVGNAPTALFEILRLVQEEGARPALVVGVPVGFVGAAESKEALAASGIPHITLPGSRGGSAIAVAITNALLRIASRRAGVIKGNAGSHKISIADAQDEKDFTFRRMSGYVIDSGKDA